MEYGRHQLVLILVALAQVCIYNIASLLVMLFSIELSCKSWVSSTKWKRNYKEHDCKCYGEPPRSWWSFIKWAYYWGVGVYEIPFNRFG